MKRLTQLVVSAFIVLFSAAAFAQNYTKPIPVGSKLNQVQSYGGTYPFTSRQTEAGNIRFFDHPKNTSSATPKNFDDPEIDISGVSTRASVQDIMGLPGLKPQPPVYAPAFTDMLDVMIKETYTFDPEAFAHEGEGLPADTSVETAEVDPMYPAHGFCPPKTLGVEGSHYYMLLECDVTRHPSWVPSDIISRTDRQVEVADINNRADFMALFGGDPLETGILGSNEEISPYKAQTYPATIMSTGYMTNPGGFTWTWTHPVTEAPENLADPYTQIFSYGFSQLDKGIVTAAYDPVYLHKIMRTVLIETTTAPDGTVTEKAWDWTDINNIASYPPETQDSLGMIYSSLMRYMPLIFYRPVDDRYKLTGYTALQLLPNEIDTSDLAATLGKYFWNVALRTTINPIDTDTLNYGDNTYVAVLNQATLGSIDQCYRDDLGICKKFADDKFYPWRQMVGLYKSDTEIKPLRENIFPHKNVSWVTIWQKTHNWVNSSSDRMSDNPNEFLEPKYFALVGPGAFFATTVRDFDKDYLVVASGEETRSGFYLYKIRPTLDLDNQLYFDAQPANPANDIAKGKLPGMVPEAFRIAPPGYATPTAMEDFVKRPGFVPYEIHAGNFDDNPKCTDLAITYRGKIETPIPPESAPAGWMFLNKYGENIIFDKGDTRDHRLFSNVVTILLGIPAGGGTKCIYKDEAAFRKDIEFTSRPFKQIASIAVHDFDGDLKDDLVIGNLNPELFIDTGGSTRYTAHAYIVKNPWTADPATYETNRIRLGFYATAFGPTDGDMGNYLKSAAGGGGGSHGMYHIPGVGALDVDNKKSIASVNGFPVMLPSFAGCAKFKYWEQGPYLDSIVELLLSIGYDKRNPGIATDTPNRDIAPMRCSDASNDMTAMFSADKKEMLADFLYDSKAPYIASMNALTPAQALNLDIKNMQNAPKTAEIISAEQWAKLETLLKFLKVGENNAKKMIEGLKAYFSGEPQSLEAALIRAMLPGVLMQFETVKTNIRPSAATNALSAFLEKLDFVKDAWAGAFGYYFRLSRGQPRLPLSKSEMTVVVVKPPELTLIPGLSREPFRPGTDITPRCGDTHITPPENCESTADCGFIGLEGWTCNPTTCVCETYCGNGAYDPFREECDTTTTGCMTGATACDSSCHCVYGPGLTVEIPIGEIGRILPICGNTHIETGEGCDPPGSLCASGVACDSTCHCPTCPDGVVEAGEACDPTAPTTDWHCAVPGSFCNSSCNCVPPSGGPVCGNGILESGEICETSADCAAHGMAGFVCNAPVSCTCSPPPHITCDCDPATPLPDCPGCVPPGDRKSVV